MLEVSYLLAFYLAVPAFLANSTPVIIAKLGWLKKLDRPVDFGKTIFGKRIFGDHKTLRGFLVGTLAGLSIGLIQYLLNEQGWVVIPQLTSLYEFLLFGALGGFGALLGDTVESFFKRQLGIRSGRPFIPFDQIDYIVGFLLSTSILISWQTHQVVFLIICGLLLNPITNIIGYILGIKKTYW